MTKQRLERWVRVHGKPDAATAALLVVAESLVLLSRWTPPKSAPKRFSTWIFLAVAPTGAVTIDGGEIHEHAWLAPSEVLRRRDAGEIELVPPTWVSLRRLAGAATADEAVAVVTTAEFEHFQTRVVQLDGVTACLWHGDAGYATGDASLPGPRHRLLMGDTWTYQRDI